MKIVSVILAVYNEKLHYLQDCINSILKQSYKNIEFIIIDDSDNQEIINYLQSVQKNDARVIYIHNDKRLGFVKSLNKGLLLVKGDYIARVDSDDIQYTDRFKIQVGFLEKNDNIDILGSSMMKIDANGNSRGVRYYPTGSELIRKMMIKNTIAHCSVMMRREVMEKLKEYDEKFEKAEDYELWMRAIKNKIGIDNISEPLIKYRISDMEKRNNLNWINNLKIKLRYFDLNNFGYRVIGILAISAMLLFPMALKKLIYNTYNKIA